MADKKHWETVYETKPPDTVSWYSPHLETSLALIERAAPDHGAAILDVGGGASTLVDDLLGRGYRDVSVLDISAAALDVTRRRLGAAAAKVDWLATDLLAAKLQPQRYDLWHDRAVFHFLTAQDGRQAYVQQLLHALKPGGHAVIATFGPEGPQRCSGLDTARYDAAALARVLGPGLTLMDSMLEMHPTPFGTNQQFVYTLFRRV